MTARSYCQVFFVAHLRFVLITRLLLSRSGLSKTVTGWVSCELKFTCKHFFIFFLNLSRFSIINLKRLLLFDKEKKSVLEGAGHMWVAPVSVTQFVSFYRRRRENLRWLWRARCHVCEIDLLRWPWIHCEKRTRFDVWDYKSHVKWARWDPDTLRKTHFRIGYIIFYHLFSL